MTSKMGEGKKNRLGVPKVSLDAPLQNTGVLHCVQDDDAKKA
jgi:hypothetical protein